MKKILVVFLFLAIGCVTEAGEIKEIKKGILASYPGAIFELSDISPQIGLLLLPTLMKEFSLNGEYNIMNAPFYKLQILYCRSKKRTLFMTVYFLEKEVLGTRIIGEKRYLTFLMKRYGTTKLVIKNRLGKNYETCSWTKNGGFMAWERELGRLYGKVVMSNPAKFRKLMKKLNRSIGKNL